MGVLIGQMITQTPFSIILSGLGVISLAGIVVNNGIVLIDYIELLKKQGYSAYDAVIQAGIYGLFISTVLTLVFVPSLYMIVDNLRNTSARLSKKALKRVNTRPEDALMQAPPVTGVAGQDDEQRPVDKHIVSSAYELVEHEAWEAKKAAKSKK